jgi:anti-sigma B factor antagonist
LFCESREKAVALAVTRHLGEAGVVTLTLTGEIDLGTVDSLTEAITAAVEADDVARVLVDLDEVRFLDSTGIGALVAGWRLANENNKTLRLINAHALVQEVLEVTGVWNSLRAEH